MISVCMATYNGAEYIREQLDSILCQLSEHDELVISDDCSNDNTIEIIQSYNEDRIRIVESQRFKSPVRNFENAIKHAKGDYVFLADQDDVWMPDKIKVMTSYFKQGYDIVVSDCTVVDDQLTVLNDSFYEINKSKGGLIANLKKNSYLGCALAFHKRLIKYILPFPQKIPMHDIWIGFVGEILGKAIFIDDKLIAYRRHGKNKTSTAERSHYKMGEKLIFRLNIIRYFPLLVYRKVKGGMN